MPRITAWLVALVVSGCGLESPFSTSHHPIVGGSPATDDPGVVLVVIPGGAGCTGTAISERVVLTAKHCTQGSTADEWRVLVGMAPLTIAEREAEYLVTEIRQTPGTGTGVGEDLSIMLLESDFEFKTYRYAFEGQDAVVVGAPVRHVGFGMTVAGDGSTAGSRNERSGSITEVYSQSLNAEVGACSGDSGGPLFDASDIVLGVAHDILDSNCNGEARFTRLEPWADMIATALTDTGGCVPDAWSDTCGDGVDNDCNGIVDDDCEPVDAGVDAGNADGDGDGDGDENPDGTVGDGGGDEKPTGKVEGGCSTGGASDSGWPSLIWLALGILLVLGSKPGGGARA